MDGRYQVLYCVFTLLMLSKFTISLQNDECLKEDVDEENFHDYQVLRVEIENHEQKKKIAGLENQGLFQIWLVKNTLVDIMVKKNNLKNVNDSLKKINLKPKLFIEDVQKAINEERRKKEDGLKLPGKQGNEWKFDRYYTLNEINKYIDDISQVSQKLPVLVEVETIGKTSEGVPLRVVRIKSDKQNKKNIKSIWVDGGMHAREWISVSSVLYLINELIYNRDAMEPEMKDTVFHILPIVNPDGYKYSLEKKSFWRKNRSAGRLFLCNGTDLNRNWDYNWNEGTLSSKCPCHDTYRGSEAASERETKAVAQYIMNNTSKFEGFVTFHSFGQYILYPWSYTETNLPDYIELKRVGKAMAAAIVKVTSKQYTVGNSANILYPISGVSMDWAKGLAKIKYSYTIELSEPGKNTFFLPPSEIVPTGKEAYAAVSALAKEIRISIDWAIGVAYINYSYAIELSDKPLLQPSKIIPTGREAYAVVAALSKEISKENSKNI